MRIAGLQKLTLLDFPGRTAATVFLPGCNFRCPFCHNADLVIGAAALASAPELAAWAGGSRAPGTVTPSQQSVLPSASPRTAPDISPKTIPDISLDEFFAFLDKRHGLLDGVCITGGEPLLQPDLADFCARIKQKGFTVKLDTNGSFPDRLRELVEAELVDYVALDVKNAPARYGETVGVPTIDLASVQASIDFLMNGQLPYEFRTTVVREMHSADNLLSLARWIEGAGAWHLQSFVDADSVLAGSGTLHAYEPAELEAMIPELRLYVPAVKLRGV